MNKKSGSSINSPSPLWVISLFVSLTEVVTGVAVIQATGVIQIALTVFVIVFPLLIAGIFFLILWYKPYVFYPPKEFGQNTNVGQFVEAMQRRQERRVEQSVKFQEIIIKSIAEGINNAFSSPDLIQKLSNLSNNHNTVSKVLESAAQIAQRDTRKALSKNLISIDTRQMLGREGGVRTLPYDPSQDTGEFLDDIWFDINDTGYNLPPYRYGEIWALKDADTEQTFLNLGRNSRSNYGMLDKYKSIDESGIKPGMKLIAFFLEASKKQKSLYQE